MIGGVNDVIVVFVIDVAGDDGIDIITMMTRIMILNDNNINNNIIITIPIIMIMIIIM